MSDLAVTTDAPSSPLAAEVARRRTFAIISHPDAGKTTLTEKLLLFGGAINLAGQVKAKGERRNTRSDWMKIERERGISVVTSVMTFEFDDLVFNLLDTPGHEDFSEDTYRTLTAVDSAVMVIDAAKGIEARTRKLFEVCRLRDIPIITFINKMDRETRDPFDLLDEIEKTLALDTTPMTWPVGRGRDFLGTYDIATGGVRLLEGGGAKTGAAEQIEISELAAPQSQSRCGRDQEELALVSEACKPFDLAAFREGHLTPVFFGSALRNFGVGDLLKASAATRRRRAPQESNLRKVEASEPRMSAFVFKIQANMDPNHRDRIAFARLCSGKLVRGMKAKLTAHRQADEPVVAAVLLRPGSRARRRGVRRRRGGHSQPRHAADRRHPDRGRGHDPSSACPSFCTGNPAPGPADRCDEGQEAQGSPAADVGRGRRAGVPPARWFARTGRRCRPIAARRAEGAARCRIRPAGRFRNQRILAGALVLGR